MNVIILKQTKQNKKWLTPSSEPIELDDKIAKSLIERGIAKDANEKETIIVKDEALSLEIEKLTDENDSKTLEIETLKEFLNIAVNSSKGTIPDGAEDYIEVDLSK